VIDPAERLYERVQVLRAQAGDAEAFAELVGRHHARLRYYLAKLLAKPQAAEDVLQDVWLDVWRGLPRLADAGAFPAWLYRVARDRALRTFRRRPPPRPLDPAELPDGPGDDGGEEFTAEDVARVHAALDALADESREVLVLRFLEEMTYDEIARVVGVPVGTVRSRLHHAKRALRRELERTMARE
jgi:RNA polymerase sigma-70 factor (ECF subfamily)